MSSYISSAAESVLPESVQAAVGMKQDTAQEGRNEDKSNSEKADGASLDDKDKQSGDEEGKLANPIQAARDTVKSTTERATALGEQLVPESIEQSFRGPEGLGKQAVDLLLDPIGQAKVYASGNKDDTDVRAYSPSVKETGLQDTEKKLKPESCDYSKEFADQKEENCDAKQTKKEQGTNQPAKSDTQDYHNMTSKGVTTGAYDLAAFKSQDIPGNEKSKETHDQAESQKVQPTLGREIDSAIAIDKQVEYATASGLGAEYAAD